jgi:hypothetical protein
MAKKRTRPKSKPARETTSPPAPGATDPRLDAIYQQVREILAAARDRAWQAVYSAMVAVYWGSLLGTGKIVR